jgi:hypothetical protein
MQQLNKEETVSLANNGRGIIMDYLISQYLIQIDKEHGGVPFRIKTGLHRIK